MKEIFEIFFHNKLIKILAVTLVFYLAVYKNKDNPKNIASDLTKEKIKENLSEAKKKSSFIIENIKKAENVHLPGEARATNINNSSDKVNQAEELKKSKENSQNKAI